MTWYHDHTDALRSPMLTRIPAPVPEREYSDHERLMLKFVLSQQAYRH